MHHPGGYSDRLDLFRQLSRVWLDEQTRCGAIQKHAPRIARSGSAQCGWLARKLWDALSIHAARQASTDATLLRESSDDYAAGADNARELAEQAASKSRQGDLQGAVADYTAVLTLDGLSRAQKAVALFKRATAKQDLGDIEGALADYSEVLKLEGLGKDMMAHAFTYRAAALLTIDKPAKAVADLLRVIEMGAAQDDLALKAAEIAFLTEWTRRNQEEARGVLLKLSSAIVTLPQEMARETAVRFLCNLASPDMKDAWAFAWQTLAENRQPEVAETLQLLRPVYSALKGESDAAVLDSLPPEQRKFAKSVLARFDGQSE